MNANSSMQGFLMTLEVFSAILLLIVAASLLPLFSLPKPAASEFYICSDAAIILSKSRGESGESLRAEVEKLGKLGSMCISFESGWKHYSNCINNSRQGAKFAFTFPVWENNAASNAQVSCWKDK